MRRFWLAALIAALCLIIVGLSIFLGVFFLGARSALDKPSDAEILIADLGKNMFIIPADAQSRTNPQPTLSPAGVASARRIYTTRCNICHGNDGKGNTPIGQNTHPRAADLTSARTQSRSDGALHWLITFGIPHTAMPGWKAILSDDEIWQLVSYLRLLPKGTDAIAQLLPTPSPRPTQPPTPTPQPTTAAARSTPVPTVSASNVVTVTIENFDYIPPTLNVSVGTRVVWVNKDEDDHTVTSETQPRVLDSGVFLKNQSWSFVFTQPGTYTYFCEPHDFMHGVVVVK